MTVGAEIKTHRYIKMDQYDYDYAHEYEYSHEEQDDH
jgi:hypothetical protein